MRHNSSRREFLKSCAASAVIGGQLPPLSRFLLAPEKSKVVTVRDPLLRGGGTGVDSSRLAKLLDRAVQALYSSDSPTLAWKKVARPGEVVGL